MVIAATFALALAACQSTTGSQEQGSAPASIQRSANAGPGTRSVSLARAEETFFDVCIQNGPSFQGTETAAANLGFVQNTRTATYYHPRYNLSVKLVDGTCSMVFMSNDGQVEVEQALEALSTSTTTVIFRPPMLGHYAVVAVPI